MRLVCEKTLSRFRGPGTCEYCLKRVKKRHPHHVFFRGSGRLDVRINILALCETFAGGDNCHDQVHAGKIKREDLIEIVAAREELRAEVIVAAIHMLRRLPKPANWLGERGLRRQKAKSKKQLAWEEKARAMRRAKAKADYQRVKAWRKKRKGNA